MLVPPECSGSLKPTTTGVLRNFELSRCPLSLFSLAVVPWRLLRVATCGCPAWNVTRQSTHVMVDGKRGYLSQEHEAVCKTDGGNVDRGETT